MNINEYKSLLSQITNAQNVQFHRDVTEQIFPLASRIDGINPAFQIYNSDFNTFSAEFDRKAKSIETDELVKKDSSRDATIVQLINNIDYYYKFPQNETEKEYARVLEFIVDNYRNVPNQNYQAETSYLYNIIKDLRKNDIALEHFGLMPLVNRLDRENREFEALYHTRANMLELKRERGTLTQLAEKTNASFDVLCQIINGMLLMPFDDTIKSILEQITTILNAQINQYKITYHRHIGIVRGRKKDNNETEEIDETDETDEDVAEEV